MEATSALLVREARLIEAMRQVVERYVGAEETDAAGAALGSLGSRLRRRIRLEENSLFPAIERRLGDPRFEPTARMRRQHAVLLELLDGIERALKEGELATVAGDLRELKAALRAHVDEEERVILPLVDGPGGDTA
jgi:hemerythrin-like domain-containing protein